MEEEQIKNLNHLLEFLNDLSGQVTDRVHTQGKNLNKELVDTIGDLKETITKELAKNKPDFSKLSITPQFKFPDIKIIKFPDRLDISLLEIEDIKNILAQIIEEVKKKDLSIDFDSVENSLDSLGEKITKELEKVRKSIPVKIDFPKLPMDNGRIAVSLPKDQWSPKTPIGKKISDAISGTFMGGQAMLSSVKLRNLADAEINPATNEKLDALIASSGRSNSIGTGNVTITTGGTAKPLSATSVPCRRVIVCAVTGHITVGDSAVVYAEATRKGVWIPKTGNLALNVSNLNLVYVDSASDGVIASYYYES